MKPSKFEKEVEMYAQTTAEKKETGKSPQEVSVVDGTQEIKEEDIMNESDPATSSPLSKNERTAMHKFV